MGRPRKADRAHDETTPVALRRAAELEFATRGFDGARLEDIAARTGLTRSSLLHHYPSKDALYAAVVGEFFGRIRSALLGGMTTSGTFEARLVATAGGFAAEMCADPVPAQLLVRELQDPRGRGETLLRAQMLPLIDLTEAFVRQQGGAAVRDGLDVRSAILDLVGAVVFCVIAAPLRRELWKLPSEPSAQRRRLRAHFGSFAKDLFLTPAARRRARSA